VTAIAGAYNLDDIRRLAKRRLPRGIFEFIDRGAEDDLATEENRAAFRRIRLVTRALTDVSKRDASTTLFGRKLAMPLAIAPTGAAGLVWVQGELELAKAAAASGIPFTLATRSMTSIEDIAAHAGGVNWFQLYVWADRSLSYGLVDRAAAAGFEALLVTVDVPVAPNREYNKRNGFSLPFNPGPRAMLDIALHPRWLLGVMAKYLMTTGMPRYENQPGETKLRITKGAENLPSTRSDNLTWEDIRELRRRWPRALLVKGILRPEDAKRAIACGADGVVVSNHGGRCLDSAVAPIEALPAIAEAVGDRGTVLMDGGVRRGGDVVKALALGAKAVLMGRPGLFGTALAGQAGAAQVIEIVKRELLTVMAQTGCPTIADIGPELVHAAARRAAARSWVQEDAA
jgi:isopentenyl diphosphate isomerase/L-lactate dehydrogenase-like FMN-dependent dehydrogenase